MGYWVKALIGGALFVGGVVLVNVKLISLLETGTCASGNTPYQIAKPCPAGAGTDIMLLTGGIFGALIGGWIFSFRGMAPWERNRPGRPSDFTMAGLAGGLAFAGSGAVVLIASLTDEAIKRSGGAQLGGIITGATFLVMGLPVLYWSLTPVVKRIRGRDERPAMMTEGTASGGGFSKTSWTPTVNLPWTTGGGGTGDQINRLERLQRLRETGALTDSEFEREKAKILSEG